MSYYPENVRNWSPSPQIESEFSPRSIQSCFPLLQGPSCRKPPSALFRSNWVTNPHRIENNVFSDPVVDCNHFWPSWIEKVLTVISCNWAPGEAGNSSGKILEKTPSHSEARKTNFQHFRGKTSCERTESYFFNRLQIQLHKNWPHTSFFSF